MKTFLKDTDGLDVVLNSLSDLGTTCSTACVSLWGCLTHWTKRYCIINTDVYWFGIWILEMCEIKSTNLSMSRFWFPVTSLLLQTGQTGNIRVGPSRQKFVPKSYSRCAICRSFNCTSMIFPPKKNSQKSLQHPNSTNPMLGGPVFSFKVMMITLVVPLLCWSLGVVSWRLVSEAGTMYHPFPTEDSFSE